jgi:tetratricopeptide (TPR) repeat protein
MALAAVWARGPGQEARWRAIEGAIAGRRWDDAEARLAHWLARSPGDGKARVIYGGVLERLGRDSEARGVLRGVRADDPSRARAQLLLGELAVKRHDAAEAERAFRDAARADPVAVDPHRRLVFLLVLEQRFEEALGVLRGLYVRTHGARDLVTIVALAAVPPDTRDLWPELGRYLARAPADPFLRRARGLTVLRLGRAEEARSDLEAAAAALEGDPVGRLSLAECRLLLGDPTAVPEALGPEPERPDHRARWWVLRGMAADARGEGGEALACWRSAVAADDRDRDAHYRLGQALRRRGEAREAKSHMDRAEALRASETQLKTELDGLIAGSTGADRFERLARLCLERGLTAEARAWYDHALMIDPTRPGLQAAIARLATAPPISGGPAPSVPRLRAARAGASAVPGVAAVTTAERPPVRVRFEDVATRSGLTYRYDCAAKGDLFIGDTMGGGVGLFDYDDDGWLDIYFVNGCPLPFDPGSPPAPNKLFRNRGDGTFEDVTDRAGVGGRGYGMGCAVGDYDRDGHADLFVTGLGTTVLYRNRGDGTFEDVTARARVGSSRWTTAAGFADLDADGDLDLVAVTYVAADPARVPVCHDQLGKPIHCQPGQFPPECDHLFRNNGDGTFTDVSREAGLDVPGGNGLGLAIADLDGDGRLDLFVANDAAPNFLFRSLGSLRFEEVGVTSGVGYDGTGRATASMGVVADDLDGDGLLDLFHTNFNNEPNTFLRNLGGGLFVDATTAAGLDAPSRAMTGFGTAALDADNDGALDLFVANGHVDDQPWFGAPMAQRPQLFLGRAGRPFVEAPATIGPYFAGAVVGRGAAAGDLDNDGRVDLVVVHRDAPAVVLRNTTEGVGHWVSVRLRGTVSGPTPVGARVSCTANGHTAVRWVTAGTSYLSQNDPRLSFGLGPAGCLDRLEVRWPSGRVRSWTGLEADRFYDIREDQGPAPPEGRPAR